MQAASASAASILLICGIFTKNTGTLLRHSVISVSISQKPVWFHVVMLIHQAGIIGAFWAILFQAYGRLPPARWPQLALFRHTGPGWPGGFFKCGLESLYLEKYISPHCSLPMPIYLRLNGFSCPMAMRILPHFVFASPLAPDQVQGILNIPVKFFGSDFEGLSFFGYPTLFVPGSGMTFPYL